MPITPVLVAVTSLAASLAGWALLAVLERFTARARTIWTATALVFALLSLAGPLSALPSTSAADALALAFMHVAVAVVLVPILAGTSPRRADTSCARQARACESFVRHGTFLRERPSPLGGVRHRLEER